ncbi:TPA: hypothetical protein ACHWKL_004154 [Providencia stuartii]|uniref:hypothetical protein n=1 Tax=Providencia TaxID=586 RepID=UPI001A2119B0|nr:MULTISPECIES: hypothetical protein [Providencia]MDF4176312.1 hypothetical protein [Providencia thailandensis]QUC26558.1 hypothetical protein JY390_04210 [Providencia stuartii]CAK6614978.1 hypothetical protein PSTU1396_15230 [Providencia stuartii]CAK6616112.1 hypothetical protein PSTU1396_17290 [Providencia stuartii]CAK6616165.1 hypothetical protein PS9952019_15230 [Providencia stuartii]
MRKVLIGVMAVLSITLMGCTPKIQTVSFVGDTLSCQYAVANIVDGNAKFIAGITPENLYVANNQFATTMFSRIGFIESPTLTKKENGVLISDGDKSIFTMSEDKSNFSIVDKDKKILHQWDKCYNKYATSIEPTGSEKKNTDWIKNSPITSTMECDGYEDSTFSFGDKSKLVAEKTIFSKKRILPNSSRICTATTDIHRNNKMSVMIVEKAKINNIDVSVYHSDGSGSIGGDYSDKASWSYACKKDKMNDKVECYMYQDGFYIFKESSGYTVLVGKDHFPGRVVQVRVGKGKPFTTGDNGNFSKSASKSIINAALKNDSMVTRYTEWPYDTPIDNDVHLEYFNEAVKLLDNIYDNYRK